LLVESKFLKSHEFYAVFRVWEAGSTIVFISKANVNSQRIHILLPICVVFVLNRLDISISVRKHPKHDAFSCSRWPSCEAIQCSNSKLFYKWAIWYFEKGLLARGNCDPYGFFLLFSGNQSSDSDWPWTSLA